MIAALPDETLNHVLSFLSIPDLNRIAAVNTQLQKLASYNRLWGPLTQVFVRGKPEQTTIKENFYRLLFRLLPPDAPLYELTSVQSLSARIKKNKKALERYDKIVFNIVFPFNPQNFLVIQLNGSLITRSEPVKVYHYVVTQKMNYEIGHRHALWPAHAPSYGVCYVYNLNTPSIQNFSKKLKKMCNKLKKEEQNSQIAKINNNLNIFTVAMTIFSIIAITSYFLLLPQHHFPLFAQKNNGSLNTPLIRNGSVVAPPLKNFIQHCRRHPA